MNPKSHTRVLIANQSTHHKNRHLSISKMTRWKKSLMQNLLSLKNLRKDRSLYILPSKKWRIGCQLTIMPKLQILICLPSKPRSRRWLICIWSQCKSRLLGNRIELLIPIWRLLIFRSGFMCLNSLLKSKGYRKKVKSVLKKSQKLIISNVTKPHHLILSQQRRNSMSWTYN